jgi:ATP-dependent DNA helicase RecG
MHLPLRYELPGHPVPASAARPGEHCIIEGEVVLAETRPGFKGRKGSVLITVNDGTASVQARWFNQPYLVNRFPHGTRVRLDGTITSPQRGPLPAMANPAYTIIAGEREPADASPPAPPGHERLQPVHPATEGLTARVIRGAVEKALAACDIRDPMPREITERHGLPPLGDALRDAHFPPMDADLTLYNRRAAPCLRRLAFDELFMLQAGVALLRRQKSAERGRAMSPPGDLLARLRAALPFSLTRAQERVTREILADMARPHPMNRLVQGDVGSGKTVVALAAMLTAVEAGAQAALMAPTEILAEQHYINIHALVETLGLRAVLLTGSTPARERPYLALASGEAHIAVGTHALIQEGVRFHDLGLAVIDEQHRFGVMQRAVLRQKGLRPDVLIMTATPIPRTLAHTLYGELDYSVIDELPPGRTPVETTCVSESEKALAYDAIGAEVGAGGQVYVVYPAVEESENADLKDATNGAAGLARKFPDARVGLVHGRMRPPEKEAAMAGFMRGEIDILVSTTVIEVGVDVPNASLMIIVHAERFGLSQLHQLRGRVGRGARASRCMMLAYGRAGQDASARMAALCRTNDGFLIAEEDLKLRGPGEVMGTRQSGLPDFRVADVLRDGVLVEPARAEAFKLIDADPELKAYPALRAGLERFWSGRAEIYATG